MTGDRKDERELREAVRARDERIAALEKRIAELEKEVEEWCPQRSIVTTQGGKADCPLRYGLFAAARSQQRPKPLRHVLDVQSRRQGGRAHAET